MDTISAYLSPSFFQYSGLLLLGYAFVYKPTRLLTCWLRNRLTSCCTSSRILKPASNDFAVITGATDGIGLEYAKQLADKGFNILLLSRTEEKLARVAAQMASKYPQAEKIETLAVDFSQTDIYESIQAKLDSLKGRVYLLVNNVGMMHPLLEHFTKMPEKYYQKLINTNILSMTVMCEIVLKKMLAENGKAEGKRPKGVIINIASGAADFVLPLSNNYGASKAYVSYLSKSLASEYESAGILVQTVTPGQVITNMTGQTNHDALVVSAESFVGYALSSVGTESVTNGHPKHKLLMWILLTVADWSGERWLQRKMLKAFLWKSTQVKEKSKRDN